MNPLVGNNQKRQFYTDRKISGGLAWGWQGEAMTQGTLLGRRK
jgi:hypothetical protein